MRLCFNNSIYTTGYNGMVMGVPATANVLVTDNQVTSVNLISPGVGYLAPPLIEFVGNGSGARGYATIGTNGSLTSITVTAGGNGYTPTPPTMVGAQVIISTGRVENIFYR